MYSNGITNNFKNTANAPPQTMVNKPTLVKQKTYTGVSSAAQALVKPNSHQNRGNARGQNQFTPSGGGINFY
jgi:hypothetical protein